jgi:hypothetical protein
VSSRRHFTEVDAGADGVKRSTGVLGIFRQNYVQVTQKAHLLKVADSGPLKITRAPLGPKVESSAQKHGKLEFTSKRGVRGVLDLKTDRITLAG